MLQICALSMVDVEVAWQNCETIRDAYVEGKRDGTRGGIKMTKGNLYCPVFKDHFHRLFFLDLPVERVLEGTEVSPLNTGAIDCDVGAEKSTSIMQANGERLRKRARQGENV
jgi:hypothetical protein